MAYVEPTPATGIIRVLDLAQDAYDYDARVSAEYEEFLATRYREDKPYGDEYFDEWDPESWSHHFWSGPPRPTYPAYVANVFNYAYHALVSNNVITDDPDTTNVGYRRLAKWATDITNNPHRHPAELLLRTLVLAEGKKGVTSLLLYENASIAFRDIEFSGSPSDKPRHQKWDEDDASDVAGSWDSHADWLDANNLVLNRNGFPSGIKSKTLADLAEEWRRLPSAAPHAVAPLCHRLASRMWRNLAKAPAARAALETTALILHATVFIHLGFRADDPGRNDIHRLIIHKSRPVRDFGTIAGPKTVAGIPSLHYSASLPYPTFWREETDNTFILPLSTRDPDDHHEMKTAYARFFTTESNGFHIQTTAYQSACNLWRNPASYADVAMEKERYASLLKCSWTGIAYDTQRRLM